MTIERTDKGRLPSPPGGAFRHLPEIPSDICPRCLPTSARDIFRHLPEMSEKICSRCLKRSARDIGGDLPEMSESRYWRKKITINV